MTFSQNWFNLGLGYGGLQANGPSWLWRKSTGSYKTRNWGIITRLNDQRMNAWTRPLKSMLNSELKNPKR